MKQIRRKLRDFKSLNKSSLEISYWDNEYLSSTLNDTKVLKNFILLRYLVLQSVLFFWMFISYNSIKWNTMQYSMWKSILEEKTENSAIISRQLFQISIVSFKMTARWTDLFFNISNQGKWFCRKSSIEGQKHLQMQCDPKQWSMWPFIGIIW